jgi:hypothetical protein
LDLREAAAGTQSFRIFQNLITLPGRQLDVVRIQPAELNLILGAKSAPAGETGVPAAETAVPTAQ